MKDYVIGIFGGLDEASAYALDENGECLACVHGKAFTYATVGQNAARKNAHDLLERLLQSFSSEACYCRCMVVGVAGIDSPKTKKWIEDLFTPSDLLCPAFFLNDAIVALYAATGGIGVTTIAGRGSIAVGRNAQGIITRSGGYPVSVLGNEGSAQWVSLSALHHFTRWLDGCVCRTPLIDLIDEYYSGLDIEKMMECAASLRRRPVNTAIAELTIQADGKGDPFAKRILEEGARQLFEVSSSCIQKLAFTERDEFKAGIWGYMFENSATYKKAYTRYLLDSFPKARLACIEQENALSAAKMAFDYWKGKIPYINNFVYYERV